MAGGEAPVVRAPAAAHPAQPVPVPNLAAPHPPTPHVALPEARPAERPAPHASGPHGYGDRGSPEDPYHGGASRGERQGPLHSREPSGDGWHRLPDQAIDPRYGEPLAKHWTFAGNPVDPSSLNEGVAKLVRDPEAPFGRDAQRHAYTEHEYAERFNKPGSAGERWANFPANDGAVPGTRIVYTDATQYLKDYGPRLDRVGNNGGKYLAVMEDGEPASWEQRALHVDSLHEPYATYTFGELPSGWTIEVSEVAPGLGQPGGSIQVRVMDSEGEFRRVSELIRLGVLW